MFGRSMKRGGSLLLATALFLAGCGAEEATGPPEGWQGTEARWWQAELDTSGAFRDLETLEGMGLEGEGVVYAANRQLAEQGGLGQDQVVRTVKRSLLPLYRNEPEVVDSLFEKFVLPKIEAEPLSGDLGAYVERFKRDGYETIRKHFREPIKKLSLGEDIPVAVPDSLRGLGGTVSTQVYIDEAGEPVAVELLESVHPVLDDIAMRAMTQMRWEPAYVRRSGGWRATPSWTRFNVSYRSR